MIMLHANTIKGALGYRLDRRRFQCESLIMHEIIGSERSLLAVHWAYLGYPSSVRMNDRPDQRSALAIPVGRTARSTALSLAGYEIKFMTKHFITDWIWNLFLYLFFSVFSLFIWFAAQLASHKQIVLRRETAREVKRISKISLPTPSGRLTCVWPVLSYLAHLSTDLRFEFSVISVQLFLRLIKSIKVVYRCLESI